MPAFLFSAFTIYNLAIEISQNNNCQSKPIAIRHKKTLECLKPYWFNYIKANYNKEPY